LKDSPQAENVKFMIKVLRARRTADESRLAAINLLQKAIDWAKSHNNIDSTLVNRAMNLDSQIEDLDKFANATINLRKNLVAAFE